MPIILNFFIEVKFNVYFEYGKYKGICRLSPKYRK